MNKYTIEILHNDNNTKGLILEKEFTELQYTSVSCHDVNAAIKSGKIINYQVRLIDIWNKQQPNNYRYKLIVE